MNYEFKLISSLDKVFFDKGSTYSEQIHGSMLRNEIYSFQMLAYADGVDYPRIKLEIEIDSEIKKYITVKSVGYVPSTLACNPMCEDDDYITKRPGMFPDPLFSIEDNKIELACQQTRPFWFSIEPNGEIDGEYPINIKIKEPEGKVVAELTYTIDIINKSLPEQTLINTGWFHTDCIADLHNADILSDRHFELIERYISVYTKFGHNMILTPIFTPPLDTEVGGERPTVQLIDVFVNDGKYRFKFDNLKRWIDICKKNGIKYYEISHLFTQWGVSFAPKIMADVDGEYKKIFGWETKALSDEYKEFLQAFMPKLIEFLKLQGIDNKCYFHISDEPHIEHMENYKQAKEIIYPYIKDYKMIDALSDYDFYSMGLLEKPVVSTNHIKPFLENKVDGFWVYYCTGQGVDVANRFMAMPSYRNRILGYQLYKYDIEGFLQWGFNFWYSQYSIKKINPYATTDAGGAFQSGDSFVVYPVDENDDVVCSLRLYVFGEALQDLRALRLLESYIGRDKVMSMLDEINGFDKYPRSIDYILKLREEINKRIKEYK